MYEISAKGNYIIIVFTSRDESIRSKIYQFPMIKTVYSFNGIEFKISEGEIMVENLVIDIKLFEDGLVTLNGQPIKTKDLEAFLQQFTAVYK